MALRNLSQETFALTQTTEIALESTQHTRFPRFILPLITNLEMKVTWCRYVSNVFESIDKFPDILIAQFMNQVIDEVNRVSQGVTYTPPGASAASPCMNDGYNPSKEEDSVDELLILTKMNGDLEENPTV